MQEAILEKIKIFKDTGLVSLNHQEKVDIEAFIRTKESNRFYSVNYACTECLAEMLTLASNLLNEKVVENEPEPERKTQKNRKSR